LSLIKASSTSSSISTCERETKRQRDKDYYFLCRIGDGACDGEEQIANVLGFLGLDGGGVASKQ
jgi:hypothetical protein